MSPFKFTLGFWANADPLSAIDKTVKLITARDADGAGTLDPSDLADNRADRSRSCRDHHRFTNGAPARQGCYVPAHRRCGYIVRFEP